MTARPTSAAEAYSRGGAAWADGPERVYGILADLLVQSSPVSLRGRLVGDIGSGTGVASEALVAAGADVIAADFAHGMLAHRRDERPPAVVADATALPFADGSLGGIVAAYCYNHLVDPVAGLREAGRVCADGSPVLASAYALDDTHPVREAVETALTELGFVPPEFYADLKMNAVPKLATRERCLEAARAAGLHEVEVEALHVSFPHLTAADIVDWRLGMAQVSWFVEGLSTVDRDRLRTRALELLGDAPALVRSIVHLVAVA